MTSVERVLEYAELESEAPWETDKRLPGDWPRKGSIIFDSVSFSYSDNTPMVLKNLSIVFTSREKVFVFTSTCAWLDMQPVWEACCGFFFNTELFRNQLLKGHHIVPLNLQDYTICDSWNTYHVIKTVQVDPFVSNLHFELPDGDNCLFSIRERRGQGRGAEEGRGEMVKDDWNCV